MTVEWRGPWTPYWWRLTHRDAGGSPWLPMGPGPLTPVPNQALATGTLADWAAELLAGAVDELDDLRGELRLECFDHPMPAPDSAPVLTRTAGLTGPGRR
ncbi:hypothetical protein [Streptomyces avicenniae]|uniref:hypothetical protein n=1 Tax=Streptomyces avicenniae TaxID=500153 RepID=UPI00069A5374|nr:hypothetical protein [Streptomyces avicenniae]